MDRIFVGGIPQEATDDVLFSSAFTRAFLLISFIAGVIDTAITDLSNGCANH